MFNDFAGQITLLMFLNALVAGTVEFLKTFVIALPNEWGELFEYGFSKEIKRWMSFFFAFFYSWVFKLRIISLIFETNGSSEVPFGPAVEYFLIAMLVFMGSKWLHDFMKISTEM